MIRLVPFCFLILVLFSIPAFSSDVFPSKFVPKEGRLLIVGQQKDTIQAYLKTVGTVPGGFMVYTSIQNLEGLAAPADNGAGIHHGQYYVSTYPNTVLQIGLYMVGALDQVLSGELDGNISKLAKWIKQARRPVFLRIGYEFDFRENLYDAQKYQKVFRYIVDQFRREKVDNVAFVWHSAAAMGHAGNFIDWYPGDEYVDWFAVSFFSAPQTPTVDKFAALAREHGKPFMIAESTPAGIYTPAARQGWFDRFFDLIRRNDAKVVCYINSRWDSYPMFRNMKWGDARVEADPLIKAMWMKETSSSEYLQSSPGLFEALAYPGK